MSLSRLLQDHKSALKLEFVTTDPALMQSLFDALSSIGGPPAPSQAPQVTFLRYEDMNTVFNVSIGELPARAVSMVLLATINGEVQPPVPVIEGQEFKCDSQAFVNLSTAGINASGIQGPPSAVNSFSASQAEPAPDAPASAPGVTFNRTEEDDAGTGGTVPL